MGKEKNSEISEKSQEEILKKENLEEEKPEKESFDLDEFPEEPPKNSISYIENALYDFLNKMIFSGYRFLLQPKYKKFFYYLIFLLSSSIVFTALYLYTNLIALNVLQAILMFDLFTCVAYVIGGLSGIVIKKEERLSNFLIIMCVLAGVLSVLFFYFQIDYNNYEFQIIKLILLITYVIIACVSIFFIMVSFHVSLTYRLLSLGNSPNRLFFSPIIKLVAWAVLFAFIGLFLQTDSIMSTISMIGIVISGIIVFKIYSTPIIDEDASYREDNLHEAKINFTQCLGFYNLYLLYRIGMSFETTNGSTSGILLDLGLMIINIFFVINSLSKKVDHVGDIDEDNSTKFSLKRNNRAIMKLKRVVSEKGMVLIALALGFGYFISLVDSFISSEALISYLGSDGSELQTNIHRASLIVIVLFLGFIIIYFKKSNKFKSLLINRYDWSHAIRMFKNVMKAKYHKKVDDVKNTLSGWGKNIKNFFSSKKDDDKKDANENESKEKDKESNTKSDDESEKSDDESEKDTD